jgi:pimeloyl-ACP methyl ester carboxylesterase
MSPLSVGSFALNLFSYPFSRGTVFLVAFLILAAHPASAQLSQNSGINQSDTYAVFDITIQGRGITTLPQAIYNPTTQTTSSTLDLALNARHYHVEVGYDLNDQLVMNIFTTDSTQDPTQSPYGDISRIELRNGKLTLFDETDTPIPMSLPNNAPLPGPLALLGAIPGSSVLQSLIISDPNTRATALNGTVSYSTQTTTSENTIGGYRIAAGTQVQMAYISYSISSGTGSTGTLAYQQFSGGWVLRESTVNSTLSNTQLTQSTGFANVLWSDSSSGNSRRAAKVTTPPPPPAYSPASIPAAPLPSAASNNATIEVQNIGQGPTNLLYQHGIFSDARTWDRMDPWIRQDFPLAAVAKSNLRSTDSLTSQANSLIGLLQGTGKSNFLAIGHSQGGLIARDVGFRRFDLVNRVIANETPNNGAWITQFERAALAGAMTDLARILVSWGSGTPLSGAVSSLGNALILGVPPITVLAFDAAIPATSDLQPGSPYLFNLNSRSEPFRNVGIKAASRWRFVEWRLIGDGACNPESACGGRAAYYYANGVYYGLLACWIIGLIFQLPDLVYFCGTTAFIMDYIDLFWYVYTSWGDSSDGMVQLGGQHYNNAYSNRLIADADSHRGATKSDKVRAMLDYALQFDFNLIPRWCQTGSAWPSSFSLPDIGGSGSFSLSTGNLCPWTAVSSVPWITITSGASGTASGTVTFSAEINLSPVARTGTITITGLGSTVAVTVNQAGIPAGAATGGVTINGSEQSVEAYWECVDWEPYPPFVCIREEPVYIWDSGNVSITVNGLTKWVNYGETSTASSIAWALATAINSDSSFPVRAGVMGTTVWLVSRATQDANYPFSSGTAYDSTNFSQPSFTTTNSGPTLTGSP